MMDAFCSLEYVILSLHDTCLQCTGITFLPNPNLGSTVLQFGTVGTNSWKCSPASPVAFVCSLLESVDPCSPWSLLSSPFCPQDIPHWWYCYQHWAVYHDVFLIMWAIFFGFFLNCWADLYPLHRFNFTVATVLTLLFVWQSFIFHAFCGYWDLERVMYLTLGHAWNMCPLLSLISSCRLNWLLYVEQDKMGNMPQLVGVCLVNSSSV